MSDGLYLLFFYLLIASQARFARSVVPIRPIQSYSVAEEEVTCFGGLPPYRLPDFRRPANYRLETDIYNANDFTLQELCAKAGGKPATQNVNAICTADSDHVWFNGPRFEYGVNKFNGGLVPSGNPTHRYLTLPLETARNMAYCLQRCVCSRLIVDGEPPPRPWGDLGQDQVILHHDVGHGIDPRKPVHQIPLHILKWSPKNLDVYDWSRLSHYKTRNIRWGLVHHQYRNQLGAPTFTIDTKNEIECEWLAENNWVPPISLPAPWTAADFPTIQSLCAVSLSGGNRNANAGGYCDPGRAQPDVAFSDEMTPWLGWTWDNLRQSTTVRFFCWSQCRCQGAAEQPKKRPLALVWAWLGRAEILSIDVSQTYSLIDEVKDNKLPTLQRKHWRFIGHTTLVLMESGGLEIKYYKNGKSRSHILSDPEGRITPWPEHILGPKDEPRDMTDNPFASHTSQKSHGSKHITCNSPSDCIDGDSGSVEPSRCVFASNGLQKYLNLDAVVPALGVCLSFALVLAVDTAISKGEASSQKNGLEILGGRSFDGEVPELDTIELTCYCNSTYVAKRCCHLNDESLESFLR